MGKNANRFDLQWLGKRSPKAKGEDTLEDTFLHESKGMQKEPQITR